MGTQHTTFKGFDPADDSSTIPGPTLFADWGDTVTIHVTNNLLDSQNGTSIHWHGIRQNHTNDQDGVVSITQCPTAPQDTITYTWRATQVNTNSLFLNFCPVINSALTVW
jgi:FtsP/CotA-like multicopper oxidase with cupredoxin domain